MPRTRAVPAHFDDRVVGCATSARTRGPATGMVTWGLLAILGSLPFAPGCSPDPRFEAMMASRSRPGFVLHETHTQTQQAVADTVLTYVTARAVRVSHAAGDAILDLEADRIILLDRDSRTYCQESLLTWEARILDAFEAMRASSHASAPPRFERVGETIQIAGYDCERHVLFTTRNLLGANETIEQQVWVTTQLKLPVGAYQAYQRALGALNSLGLPTQAVYPPGIILRNELRTRPSDSPRREAPAVEMSNVFYIESKELSVELFMIPFGYTPASPAPEGPRPATTPTGVEP